MIKKFYLEPVDGRKSFYNKCYVQEIGNEATLYSYDTKIVTYNMLTGELTKTSSYDYGRTTKRHQKAFFNYYSIEA